MYVGMQVLAPSTNSIQQSRRRDEDIGRVVGRVCRSGFIGFFLLSVLKWKDQQQQLFGTAEKAEKGQCSWCV